MQILIRDYPRSGPHVVLVFGLGMIGTAIRDVLERMHFRSEQSVEIDWKDPTLRMQAYAAARRACLARVRPPGRASIVWSAGKANFFSTHQDTADECQSFSEVLQLALELRQVSEQTRIGFHHLSSAGGLFEGQRIVDCASVPAPLRPYGEMKLFQENQLKASLSHGEIAIYRPSSVYGPMIRPRRHGLINQLMANAANRRSTVLDANVMALRDYVYAGDIGEYIARNIAYLRAETDAEPVHFLVSARCASIFEVVAKIERVMNLKVRYRFDEHFGNSANITFSNSVLPPGWRPSTLEVGIRQFKLRDRPQSLVISTTEDGHR